jgi:hypothetical protein
MYTAPPAYSPYVHSYAPSVNAPGYTYPPYTYPPGGYTLTPSVTLPPFLADSGGSLHKLNQDLTSLYVALAAFFTIFVTCSSICCCNFGCFAVLERRRDKRGHSRLTPFASKELNHAANNNLVVQTSLSMSHRSPENGLKP